jgi:hypothetical protein
VAIKLNGQGQDRVHFAVHNNSSKRLYVVLPPGLVASSVTGQLQSMGLGAPNNNPGSFGNFRSAAPDAGLRSVPVQAKTVDGVIVPAGQSLEFNVPSVCLNYGLPTPTPRDVFKLVDVDTYSPDLRVRKALRTLATLGTSHGVAQATMWRVCNNVPFEMMTSQFAAIVNPYETALAVRLVDALDSSASRDLVEPTHLTEGRLFVKVSAEGSLAGEASRITSALEGLHILGLPARAVSDNEPPAVQSPALYLGVVLAPGRAGETKLRIAVRHASPTTGWMPLGVATFTEGSSPEVLDGPTFARAVDRAIALAFVNVKPAKHTLGSTTFKVENHLPFSLTNVVVKAGNSAGSPSVSLPGLGVGPARSALAPIQAAHATIERVEVNGL